MSAIESLKKISEQLNSHAKVESPEAAALIAAAEQVSKSWSGSWLGYQSCVYYRGFVAPPPGANFSVEWGLDSVLGMGTHGDWTEYRFQDVAEAINEIAGRPNLQKTIQAGQAAENAFNKAKSTAQSIIHAQVDFERDKYLQGLVEKIESIKLYDANAFIKMSRPRSSFYTRDSVATDQGIKTPPHITVWAKAFAFLAPFSVCKNLQELIDQLVEHLNNIGTQNKSKSLGTHIFIGHGRSPMWRELKDFIGDRLSLRWDEFNRVPVAGISTVTRLAAMLDQASFAFLIMTAEDELADGSLHARMNVIHEVGLFQGRLGFDKAIVLIEEGCQEFSNIQGLGQVRFPKGKISAVFEDVRQILEHSGVIGQL